MKGVLNRKRQMAEGEVQFRLERFKATGADLIKGEARFVAPKTVDVNLNEGGRRTIMGDRVFLDLGSRSIIPEIPGLAAAKPMTHVEAVDLDRSPAIPEIFVSFGIGTSSGKENHYFGLAVGSERIQQTDVLGHN